ncbi:hypothetical protein [Salinicoccus sp. YB14-2]|uniref:hypothetical protein n=1 Tax=Salinicoccus sp. YB14-2 TaxID=1572701 RepID=UPI0012E12EA3|nr:hypothetical protein [Salinicoccus sp. YB14-2]
MISAGAYDFGSNIRKLREISAGAYDFGSNIRKLRVIPAGAYDFGIDIRKLREIPAGTCGFNSNRPATHLPAALHPQQSLPETTKKEAGVRLLFYIGRLFPNNS